MKAQPFVHAFGYCPPYEAALRLKGLKNLTLLESVMAHPLLGRYSFLMADPIASLISDQGKSFWQNSPRQEPVLELLAEIIEQNSLDLLADLPPFQGGFSGFISYEYAQILENSPKIPSFTPLCPELILHFYDVVLAFDHYRQKSWIISTGLPANSEAQRQKQARLRADYFTKMLKQPLVRLGDVPVIAEWQSNFTAEAYETAVSKVINYILDGDIFQANIAQIYTASCPENYDGFAFYQNLRKTNPAPFAALLDYGDWQIISSSPERLVSLCGSLIQARPIKGTRRRSSDPQRDAVLQAELLASPKDRAENIMIVDLLRNDLAKVSMTGTVAVPDLCTLESYAGIHHLTSVITGQLREDQAMADLLKAVFPGGSITGAPKIRAREIIAEIEQRARGIYCGSIGYIGLNGFSDFNIAIRTVMISKAQIHIGVGGGITARSDPHEEYEETLVKLSRIMEAFSL